MEKTKKLSHVSYYKSINSVFIIIIYLFVDRGFLVSFDMFMVDRTQKDIKLNLRNETE